jgi:hypothetical protein
MKMLKYFLLVFLIVLIRCDEDEHIDEEEHRATVATSKSSDSLQKVLKKASIPFELMEHYLIKSHNYIKEDLGLEYPMDLLFFTFAGCMVYYLFSKLFPHVIFLCKNRKHTFTIHLMNRTTMLLSEMYNKF